MNDLKIMALIPARAGSKRIKNKNIRLLVNKPLISYKLEAVLKTKLINKIVICTDSNEIKNIAENYNIKVPFMRPVEISQDNSTELEYYRYTLKWLEDNEGYSPDIIVNLYPTSPFVKPETIDEAIELMMSHPEADSLRSIVKCSKHPYKMWIEKGDYLEPFVETKDSNAHTFSIQMLPAVYVQNACIYITKPSTINKFNSPVGNKVLKFIMNEMESVDINNEIDFLFAEMLMDKKVIC